MNKQEMIAKFDEFAATMDFGAEIDAWYKAPDRMTYRHDLAAMLLLDEILPGNEMLLSDANHGTVWLSINLDALAEIIDEDDIRELVVLGVVYDETSDQFVMGSANFDAYGDEDDDGEPTVTPV